MDESEAMAIFDSAAFAVADPVVGWPIIGRCFRPKQFPD